MPPLPWTLGRGAAFTSDLGQAAVDAVLLKTRPDEMSCEDWIAHVGCYAEHVLAGRAIPSSLEAVVRHIDLCPECAEEFQAILAALREELSRGDLLECTNDKNI